MRGALACTLVILAATAATLSKAGEPPEGIEEHAAMPQPGGEPTLRLDVLLPRAVWGEWERVRFNYRIVNATENPIRFEDGDPGRGFAGKIMYLRDARGKVRAFGAHWAAPPRYRPNFSGRPKAFDPGAVVQEQAGLEPAEYFGRLGAGKHTLQVVVPAGRMNVDGKRTAPLASAPVNFDVVALTRALRRTMEAIPRDAAGVSLEPLARAVTPDKSDRSIKLRLINGSKGVIRFPQYVGMDLAPTEAESFGGDGRWRNESLGWCGTFLGGKELGPKEAVTITTYVPSETGRFVRFILRVAEDGKTRPVVSPVVELTD
jgi:hypothetical protein